MSVKRTALGRGLSALIPPGPGIVGAAPPSGRTPLTESVVPLALIDPNPAQPRTSMRPEALEQLSRSIQESGVVQPILLRPIPNGRYQIIAGERRFRAAQKLGHTTIPAAVRTVADDRVLEFALVENIQREELSPIEEAHALRRLQDELGLTQEALAGKVGKDRATIANTIRLLRLPADVREELQKGSLSAGHARALLAIDDQATVKDLAAQAIKQGWSVRQTEARVQAHKNPAPRKTKKVDPNTRAAEERLKAKLGARVEIRRSRGKGEIRIGFDNEAELNRLFTWILRG